MSPWKLAVVVPLWLGVGIAPAQHSKPAPDVLRRPGETTVISFVTASGKTASLCEGAKHAYLVYRFGNAAKTELQYPAVLDASSWQKFTYLHYERGGGYRNAGMEDYQLSFRNGGAKYTLTDHTEAYLTKAKNEDYRREVGLDVVLNQRPLAITVRQASVNGSLYLSDEQRELVRLEEDEEK